MLSPDVIREFDAFRKVEAGRSACPAPAVNLHFSQMGVVTACCFNRRQVLGVYPSQSLTEIWHGEAVRELRDALDRYDLSKGCEKCEQQIAARDFGGSHAAFYTLNARVNYTLRRQMGLVPPGDPFKNPMPARLEFNVHNACNLQCVMCHGLASSSIQTKREGLSPLPNPYDEAFVDQLEEFLPWVVETDFMGGEPFLIPVYIMIWERIAQVNPKIQAIILTNGTTLNDRIRGILERINCTMHVSIDSVFKKTYESIRRGASYEEVMEHVGYYVELMRGRGRPVMFRFCPMRMNWREIPDTVAFCNERGIALMYNQVDSPVNLSLHTLSKPELQTVVTYLKQNAPAEGDDAVHRHNYQNYCELVHRFEGFLDDDNRLTMLRARLTVSDAVTLQYTREKRAVGSRALPLAPPDESSDALNKAARRYLITRMNVEQAQSTDGDLPQDVMDFLAHRTEEMHQLLETTDLEVFVKRFLKEVVRTYSAVWGVAKPHDPGIFGRIDEFVGELATDPDREAVVLGFLTASPGDLYDAMLHDPLPEVARFFAGAEAHA